MVVVVVTVPVAVNVMNKWGYTARTMGSAEIRVGKEP